MNYISEKSSEATFLSQSYSVTRGLDIGADHTRNVASEGSGQKLNQLTCFLGLGGIGIIISS